jgi:hypothetical protein
VLNDDDYVDFSKIAPSVGNVKVVEESPKWAEFVAADGCVEGDILGNSTTEMGFPPREFKENDKWTVSHWTFECTSNSVIVTDMRKKSEIQETINLFEQTVVLITHQIFQNITSKYGAIFEFPNHTLWQDRTTITNSQMFSGTLTYRSKWYLNQNTWTFIGFGNGYLYVYDRRTNPDLEGMITMFQQSVCVLPNEEEEDENSLSPVFVSDDNICVLVKAGSDRFTPGETIYYDYNQVSFSFQFDYNMRHVVELPDNVKAVFRSQGSGTNLYLTVLPLSAFDSFVEDFVEHASLGSSNPNVVDQQDNYEVY